MKCKIHNDDIEYGRVSVTFFYMALKIIFFHGTELYVFYTSLSMVYVIILIITEKSAVV